MVYNFRLLISIEKAAIMNGLWFPVKLFEIKELFDHEINLRLVTQVTLILITILKATEHKP
jgi:hypothetical protein